MLYGKKINAVPRTKTPEQALAALMRLCARAERSEEDARRLMTRWGVAPADRERSLRSMPVRHANGWPTCCAARCAPPAPQHLMN